MPFLRMVFVGFGYRVKRRCLVLSELRLYFKPEQPRWHWWGDAVNGEWQSLLLPLVRTVLIAFAFRVMRRSEILSVWGRRG